MDLEKPCAVKKSGGFPRTRGDGPATAAEEAFYDAFPPHTRGWTARKEEGVGLADVSPAHAGMDRLDTSANQGKESFPRTRGDGPCSGSAKRLGTRFSPAHAGMDPGGRLRLCAGRGFPRTRGDGPPQGEKFH